MPGHKVTVDKVSGHRCVTMVTDDILAMFIGPQKADQLYFYHLGNDTWEKCLMSFTGHGRSGTTLMCLEVADGNSSPS